MHVVQCSQASNISDDDPCREKFGKHLIATVTLQQMMLMQLAVQLAVASWLWQAFGNVVIRWNT